MECFSLLSFQVKIYSSTQPVRTKLYCTVYVVHMYCVCALALKMLVKRQSRQQVFHNLGASPQGDALNPVHLKGELGFHVLKHIIPALVLC